MPELQPVREYVFIEGWLYENGDVGWRINSEVNEEVDFESLEQIVMEMAEDLQDPDDDDTVVLSLMFREKGEVYARWFLKESFCSFPQFLWLRRRMYRAQWKIHGRDREAGFFLRLLWVASWLYHRWSGHLGPRRRVLLSTKGATPQGLTELLSEQSEGLEKGSCGWGQPTQIIPFPSSGR